MPMALLSILCLLLVARRGRIRFDAKRTPQETVTDGILVSDPGEGGSAINHDAEDNDDNVVSDEGVYTGMTAEEFDAFMSERAPQSKRPLAYPELNDADFLLLLQGKKSYSELTKK